MWELANDSRLYHGSYCEVRKPDLKLCARYKDFGQGFYLTTSKKQAENFAKISTKKAAANGIADEGQRYGIVSVFRFQSVGKLSVKIYSKADAAWLRCIVGYRKRKIFPEIAQELQHFDVIAGKVANDNTNATITTYMAGAFGEIGTERAENICISLLLPERLQDQFCFKTDKALRCLEFAGSEKIWM